MSSEAMSEILSRLTTPEEVVPPNFTVLLRNCGRVLDDLGPAKSRLRDADKLLRILKKRILENDWKDVSLSFVMEAGEHAFSPAYREDPEFDRVRVFFLDEIPASDRPGFLGAMTRIYIETFEETGAHTQALATALKQVAARIGAQWQKVLANFPSLFDPSKVVNEIAEKMASLGDIWSGLRDLGIRQPHAPGLMVDAHFRFLQLVGRRLREKEDIERLLAWLKPEGQPAMATGAAEAVVALLQPWKEKGIPADLKQILMDRLLDLYGHPKVSRNAIWNQVPPEIEGMFLHWLTGADIRMLFRILNEVERGHMWADREEFWWDLYEKNRIDEVWVAFNREGHRAAQSKVPRDLRQKSTHVRFALQEGDRDKSLLIMRIGKKIVVEGTYNFKVHIFDADARNAPKLYQRKYDVANIRGSRGAETIPHLGFWQGKVMMGI